jgi:molecular chaperone GrpE
VEAKAKKETKDAAAPEVTEPAEAGTSADAAEEAAPKVKPAAGEKKVREQAAKEPQEGGTGKKKATGWPNLGGSKRKAAKHKEETKALQTRLLRLQADFENFRKRTLREKTELYKNANEDILLELLPVLDHVELALGAAEQHGADPAFMEGFKLVGEQLGSALGKFGLKAIEADAMPFDPNCHEAVSHLPSGEVEEGRIMAVARRGYMLGDQRVLRAAQVVVSSGAPEATAPATPPPQGADEAPDGGKSDRETVAEA